MLKFLFPREEDFFQLFQSAAEEFLSVIKHFKVLLRQNIENRSSTLEIIRDHEKRADVIINNTFEKLHKTFITPFDRYDIHRFIKKLNEGIEAVLGAAERIEIYKPKIIPNELQEMAELGLKSAEAIHMATKSLHRLKNVSQVLQYCEEVKNLESKGEKLLLAGTAKLFKEENDAKELLKTKEIYDYTKFILNECEVVANILKDIVLEYS